MMSMPYLCSPSCSQIKNFAYSVVIAAALPLKNQTQLSTPSGRQVLDGVQAGLSPEGPFIESGHKENAINNKRKPTSNAGVSGACDLCGLSVGAKPFYLESAGKRLQFCCDGCLGIYQMLHESEPPATTKDTPPKGETP